MNNITTKEAARSLGISERRVRQLAKSRDLGREGKGGIWLFSTSDIENMKTRPVGRPSSKTEDNPLTKSEFENLLSRAAQPRPSEQPDSKEGGTSGLNPPDDCNENHIHPDNSQGT